MVKTEKRTLDFSIGEVTVDIDKCSFGGIMRAKT